MKKLSRKLLPFFLSFIALVFTFVSVLAAEDFTTYTEVDTGDKITVTSNQVTWADLLLTDDGWIYDDKGSGNYSDNFSFNFSVNITASAASMSVAGLVWGLSIDIGDWGTISANDTLSLDFTSTGATPVRTFTLVERNNGFTTSSAAFNISLNTAYFLTITRDESASANGTLYAYIYSDFERETLLTTLTVTLTEKQDFQYLYPLSSRDSLSALGWGGSVQNLEDNTGLPVVITGNATDQQYYDEFDTYSVNLTANVVSDGGENVNGGFFYRDTLDTEFSYRGAAGTYNTGDNITLTLWPLEINHEYQYYAYIQNADVSENATGGIQSFICNPPADLPEITTLAYPFSADSDNFSATMYGYIIWDGNSSSNVTGWIQYSTIPSGNWTDTTDNVTDLVTGDQYSVTTGNLSLYTWYYFRARASNAEGTVNATGVSSFILGYETTTPVITTGNVTFITDTTAILHGVVTDNGSANVFAYFQYRVTGTTTWSTTAGYYVDEGETYSRALSGFIPATSYDYRAVGWNFDVSFTQRHGYGDIKQFATFTTTSIPIMSTNNVTYLSPGVISVTGTVTFDGGSPVGMWFQAREYGTETWIDSDTILPGYTTGDEGTWYISGLEHEKTYQVRSVGQNYAGTGYGNIITFIMGAELDIDVDDDDDDDVGIDVFAGFISDIRVSLGMTGAMGTWAFMALILFGLALIFGVAMIAVESKIKVMIGVVWALCSIAVVGAFIFTGQLGVWPIIILVSGVVILIMIIGGSILSGSKSNG